MSRGASSGITFLVLVFGAITIIVFMSLQPNPISIIERQYSKDYNNQVLINILKLLNENNESLAMLIELNECNNTGLNETFINESIKKMVKRGFKYIMQINELKIYDNKPSANLTRMEPASMELQTSCEKNATILFGMYNE